MRWEARVSKEKNRFYVILDGLFEDEDVAAVADALINAIKDLKPGFDFHSNAAGFRPMSQSQLNDVKRFTDALVAHGVRRTARVVGISQIAQMQLQRMASASGYEARAFPNAEEADAYLDAEMEKDELQPP